jgi:sec-independent protein translocase protein TatC
MKQHLDELSSRLIRSLIAVVVVFFACYYFSNDLYALIAKPFLSQLPVGASLIATQVTAPFMVPLTLSFLCSLLICAPFLLYQIWMFISPGLYKHERKHIAPTLIASCLLFYCGITFALLIICPVALKFFTSSAPKGVTVMIDIGNYLDFVVTIAIATGIAFQIPILTTLLIKTGFMSKQDLAAKRRHVIVLAFVLGMILAPPDVISQVLLALPMWFLFELGLLFAKNQKEVKPDYVLEQPD